MLNSYLVDALQAVIPRLAKHTEYQKYADFRQNAIDTLTILFAKHVLSEYHAIRRWDMGEANAAQFEADSLDELTMALTDTTERLRLHAVSNAHTDVAEHEKDIVALTDAESALHSSDGVMYGAQ